MWNWRPIDTLAQAAEEYYNGRTVELFGVAQTIYFCLQGEYSFDSENKQLKFEVKVSEECENLLQECWLTM